MNGVVFLLTVGFGIVFGAALILIGLLLLAQETRGLTARDLWRMFREELGGRP